MEHDTVLLTMDDIEELCAKRDKVIQEITKLNRRRVVLDVQLSAARALVTDEREDMIERCLANNPDLSNKYTPLAHAIEAIVQQSKTPITMKVIRSRLSAEGYTKTALTNHTYETIERLVADGKIVKDDKVFLSPPPPQ